MTQKGFYDQLESDNTAYPWQILPTDQDATNGPWQKAPRRITVEPSLFRMSELMERMSDTGHHGQVYIRSFSVESSALVRLQSQLAELADLEDDWNGYGAKAPNQRALTAAAEALDILNDLDIRLPSRIVASADGGVSLVFLVPGGYVDIECFNEGDILAGFQFPGRPPEVEEVVLDREFLLVLSERIRQLGHA